MKLRFILALLVISQTVYAQDSLFVQLATSNQFLMTYSDGLFGGEGWEILKERAQDSQHVLVGEDHFTKEIPDLIAAIGFDNPFDNFYIEVDPYTTELLAESFGYSDEERSEFNLKYGRILSFYSLSEEYSLLEKMVNAGMDLLGSDQIVMYDDRLLFDNLSQKTNNPQAKSLYNHVSAQSKIHFDNFLKDPQNNSMYMLTSDFRNQLQALTALEISEKEKEIIDKLLVSANIYTTQSHSIRVQLMKHHLMNDYDKWIGKRNLFKYGANHMARGESFLTVMDIGNLVANLSEANYQSSLHIMVMGESGIQATAFETFPTSPINPDGFYLKHLKPFFQFTKGSDWAVFDLVPMRKALTKGNLQVDNKNLERTIKGFDFLVLIPEVTPGSFK